MPGYVGDMSVRAEEVSIYEPIRIEMSCWNVNYHIDKIELKGYYLINMGG